AGFVTGTNNLVLSDGTHTYEYDAEGNRTKRTEIATGNSISYTWDFRNRLTLVVYQTADGTVTKQVAYGYDVFDRRITKDVDANGDGVFETGQRFVYDSSGV